MPTVQIKEMESPDNALRRFRRLCDRAGIVSEARRRRYWETPAQARKRKRVTFHLKNKNRFGNNRKKGINLDLLLRQANIEINPPKKTGPKANT